MRSGSTISPVPTIGFVGRLAQARRPLQLVALAKKREAPASSAARARVAADDAVQEVDERLGRADEREPLLGLDARRRRACRRRCGWRSRVVADRRPAPARSSRARTARGSRTSRRTRRCGGCSAARGTASAGRCASRRRRRCRSRPRAPAAPPRPTRPAAADVGELHRLRHDERLDLARDLARARAARCATRAPRRRCRRATARRAASAPCSCAPSVISRSARMSPSSQSRAETYGYSSHSGLIEQYSVHTAAQPPSAFIAAVGAPASTASRRRSRCSAAPGRSGFEASSGRSCTGSKRMSWRSSGSCACSLVEHRFRRAMYSCSSSSTPSSMPGSS